MSKGKIPIFIISDELNNCTNICQIPESEDGEYIQRESSDPPNKEENSPSCYTFTGKAPGRDYWASPRSSVSGDLWVTNNLSPSQPSVAKNARMIPCRVCETLISIQGKLNEHLVKCVNCHEITPIKEAPPGITYVYCTCNRLAVVKGDLNEIKCPRPDCGKMINFIPSPVEPPKQKLRHIYCADCMETFKFRTSKEVYDNCPQCGKSSYFLENESFGCVSIIYSATLVALAVIVFVSLVIKLPHIALDPVFYSLYLIVVIAFGIAIIGYRMSKNSEKEPGSKPRRKSQNWSRINLVYRRYV